MDRVWLTRWGNDTSIKYANPNMTYYRDRVLSFKNWPLQICQNKHVMASAGLYYTDKGDLVKCFSCGLCLGQWLKSDEVWNEHRKWSPNCPFIKMVGCKNDINVRLETFV